MRKILDKVRFSVKDGLLETESDESREDYLWLIFSWKRCKNLRRNLKFNLTTKKIKLN